MITPYHDHILDARDVCANCHRLIRVERLDLVRGGINTELDSHYSRRKRTTTVEYAPAESASESKGVFCGCGVEDSRVRDRLWSPGNISRERFRDLLTATTATLTHKDVTISRERFASVALAAYDAGRDADDALEIALDAALAVATASTDTARASR
jgi:hypothetical protein